MIYILIFMLLLWNNRINNANGIPLCLGLFVSVYLLYTGIAAAVCRYADKGGRKIYKGANVFLIRQFSSKIRTMQFTMGTLTVLLRWLFL